jgi:glycosyltransferase involved in cell wall biosynthesis
MTVSPETAPKDSRTTIEAVSVAILMCTRNGAAFLSEQLQSFADQTHKNWILYVSDDGSTDDTKEIVRRFADQNVQKAVLRKGPERGASVNFHTLATDPAIDADYYAFSDQDDVWYKDKLARALAWLATVPSDVPAFYCARTELITVDGKPLGLSPLFTRPPAFRNALVQSLGGGNTMVFNRATKALLSKSGIDRLPFYDWWVYQLVSAVDGAIRYDPEPVLKYRQHSDNLVGTNRGLGARFKRMRIILSGGFRDWNTANIGALRQMPAHLIKPENRAAFEAFNNIRAPSLLNRLRYLAQSGVYRQNFFDNIGLFMAILLKKI